MPTPLTRALALLLTAVLALAAAADILRAEEIPATSSLPPIFNGRDLTGWTPPAESHWKVVDGILVGENDAEKKGSMLYTDKAYGDVILEGEVRWEGEIDSGFMVRKPELQLQIGVSRSLKRDMTCSFYVGNYPEEAQASSSSRGTGIGSGSAPKGTRSPSGSTASRSRSTRRRNTPTQPRSDSRSTPG
jgi:hypothetical protein